MLVELAYDKDGKILGRKENKAIESLFEQARGDLVALNILHEMLEPERRGVRYVFTNLGKAVVKSLLCKDDTKSSNLPTANKANPADARTSRG